MTIPAYRDPAGFSSSYHQQIYTVHHPVANVPVLSVEPDTTALTDAGSSAAKPATPADSPSETAIAPPAPDGAGSD